MQFIQATPAMQLVQALEANQAVAQPIHPQPFVPTEYVPVTVEELKARAVQATEESQADKGIDHTLHTCGQCATIWRSRGYTLCPTCAGHVGDILFLDYNQRIDLHDATFDQKEVRTFTRAQMERALDEFRALLEEYAPWYDRTNRKLIQACHEDLCRSGGTSSKVALAIHFFELEWTRASDDEKTFCREVIQE
jgi:hypothetical protein